MSLRGNLVALQFIWSLKKGTRTFNFRLNEPSRDNLGPMGRHDHPWEEKKTNKHAFMIFLLAKKKQQNSTFLKIET